MIHLPVSLFIAKKSRTKFQKSNKSKNKISNQSLFDALCVYLGFVSRDLEFLKRITNTQVINDIFPSPWFMEESYLVNHPWILFPRLP